MAASEAGRRAVARARSAAAVALRARIAGDDADRAAGRIWGATGERWFTPADPIWRVHEDASMFSGGIRALLLQSLHPLAMAGVAEHSGYRGDPWGRLQRTSHYIAITTYGTVPHAEATIAAVRHIHERVTGTAPDGRPYAASDPHLLRWVHVAEADSFLTTYQAYAAHPLTRSEQDAYVAQSSSVAARLGVDDLPTDLDGLRAALEAYRPELEPTAAAREAARFLLRTPPISGPARLGYWGLAAGALAVLPAWARSMLGVPVAPGPVDRLAVAAAGRPLGRAMTAASRWLMTDPGLTERSRSAAAGSAG